MDHHVLTLKMKRRLWVAAAVLILLLLCGTLLYQMIEGWSWIDALYFTATTITTVGYGDLVPTHDVSKLITIIYSFLGIGIFLYLMSTVGASFIKFQEGKLLHHFEDKEEEDHAK